MFLDISVKLKSILINILIILSLLIIVTPVVLGYEEVLDQYSHFMNAAYSFGSTESSIAQSFIPEKNTLTKIKIFIAITSYATTGAFGIFIRDELNGNNLRWTVDGLDELTEAGVWYEWELSSHLSLTPGEDYFILLWLSENQPSGENIIWPCGILAPDGPATSGEAYFTTDGGSTWNGFPDILDFRYETWGYDELGPPGNPTDFDAKDPTDSSIDMTWTMGSDSEKTKILRKTTGYPQNEYDGTVVFFDYGESYTDSDVNPGTRYYYRAWAWNSYSGYSNGHDDDNEYTLPSAPTSFMTFDPTPDSLALSCIIRNGERIRPL